MIRFDTLPLEVTQAMCTPMHQILAPVTLPLGSPSPTTGALYLGSLAAVYDAAALREAHISHIVQVLDVPWMPLTEKEGFSCYKIPVMDDIAVDIRPHLEEACTNIDKALRNGNSVLVHCQQGVSRSAAIVIAYLIRNLGMSYETALDLVKGKRACVKPNSGFVRALQDWESSIKRPSVIRRFTT